MLVEVIKDENLVRLSTIKQGDVFRYDLLHDGAYYLKTDYEQLDGCLYGCIDLTDGGMRLFKHDTRVRPVENAKVVIE